jgi:nucleotide-binding universal stress UspA family protein
MIVVGFDGSGPAEAALRWAAGEAALRGVELHVVRAWNLVEELTAAMSGRDDLSGPVPPVSELEASAHRRLEDDVAAVLPAEDRSSVRCRAVQGHPVSTLLEAAAQAELLVLGPRGRGRVAELVLGSVSLACVHQSACPVVVVHR